MFNHLVKDDLGSIELKNPLGEDFYHLSNIENPNRVAFASKLMDEDVGEGLITATGRGAVCFSSFSTQHVHDAIVEVQKHMQPKYYFVPSYYAQGIHEFYGEKRPTHERNLFVLNVDKFKPVECAKAELMDATEMHLERLVMWSKAMFVENDDVVQISDDVHKAQIKQAIASNSVKLILCNNKPIGYILFGLKENTPVKRFHINNIYIEEAYRSQGFAKCVMQKIIQKHIEKYPCPIMLMASKHKAFIIKFYESLGFEKVCEFSVIRVE